MTRPKHIIGCYADSAFTSYLLVDIQYGYPDKAKIVRQIDNTYSRVTCHPIYYTPQGQPFFYHKKRVLLLDDFERYDLICPF